MLVESYLPQINPERLFFLSFKPGYRYPERTWKIFQFLNKIHVSFHSYYPAYNPWMWGEIFGTVNNGALKYGNTPQTKELYLVVNEINKHRMAQVSQLFTGRTIQYLKLTNIHFVKAKDIGLLARHSQRVCLKNVVVTEISKEVMKSECKYITMKGVSNI